MNKQRKRADRRNFYQIIPLKLMKIKVLFLLTTLLFFAACTKEIRQAFGEMFELSGKLGEKFGEGSPNVSIGQKGISVTFVNSSFNDLPPDRKKAKAREIALFVAQNYSDLNRLEDITIVFGIYKNFLGFEYKNNLDFHPFKVTELKEELLKQ